jgi:hypothetical protein
VETLARERAYLRDNHEKLSREYPGKYLLIKDEEVHGAFDSEDEGVSGGIRKFPTARSFLVRHVDQVEDPVLSNPALSLGIPLTCSP